MGALGSPLAWFCAAEGGQAPGKSSVDEGKRRLARLILRTSDRT